jgi:hypothetical protein
MRIEGFGTTAGTGRIIGRALVPAGASARTRSEDRGRPTGRALVPVLQVAADEPPIRPVGGRTDAPFLTQLIASRIDRVDGERRRAGPTEAGRAYADALKRVDRFTPGRMLQRSF